MESSTFPRTIPPFSTGVPTFLSAGRPCLSIFAMLLVVSPFSEVDLTKIEVPFSPTLTIGEFPEVAELSAVATAIEELSDCDFSSISLAALRLRVCCLTDSFTFRMFDSTSGLSGDGELSEVSDERARRAANGSFAGVGLIEAADV
ncbi:unnamed protein product [Haemonchus placei]|uniref:Uncharacterized protein n=1 Tax=Haemonchus placei TaxID=6290 RepID=A0A3P7XQF9_HAEPC|nr:unnamed protein product [Haemonchus placei]